MSKRIYWVLTKGNMARRIAKAQAAYDDAVGNVDNLHVSISDGNIKLGAIPSVSLIPVMDCGNCGLCSKSCYDLRNDLIYKGVIKSRATNSAILHEDPERYFKEIDGYINYRFPRAFRFHVGGDIKDEWYLGKMCEIARNHPETKFLTFTKMFKVCNGYLDKGNVIPENLHILFSGWLGLDMPNPHGFPEAHPIFENGTSAPEGTMLCSGNCTECLKEDRLCWEIGKGQAVGFLAH